MTRENFEDLVNNNDIVLIDFWAPWCGPCKVFGPVFEAASEQHEDAVFGKVNTEEQQELAGTFGISSIPTLMVFREQIGVFAQPGALPAPVLEDVISQVKGLDMNDVRRKIAEAEKEEESTG
jgi:thioredoxin